MLKNMVGQDAAGMIYFVDLPDRELMESIDELREELENIEEFTARSSNSALDLRK